MERGCWMEQSHRDFLMELKSATTKNSASERHVDGTSGHWDALPSKTFCISVSEGEEEM